MENKNYITLVLDETKEDIKEYYQKDKKGWIYNLGSAILIAIVSPIVYNKMGLIMDSQFWLSLLAGVISGLLILVIWFLGVAVISFLKTPAKLYREKERELKLYTWEKERELKLYTWETAPISIQPFDIASGEKGWAIRVDNNKKFPISVKSQPIEVSKNGEQIFNEDGHWAFLGFVNRRDGIVREKVVHHRDMRDYKTREKYSSAIDSSDYLDIVLTKVSDEGKYEFETDQDKIPISSEGSVLELKLAGYVVLKDGNYHLPTISMIIQFDNVGFPEIITIKDEN